MAQIKFVQLSQAKYDSLQTKLTTSIYFTTDTNRIYKGTVLFTGFQVISLLPVGLSAKNMQTDCLYVYSVTGDMYIKANASDTTLTQVGGNSAKMAAVQQNIASNYSTISAISGEIYAAETGIKARLKTAEDAIDALGSLENGEGISDALAKKLNVSAFETYSSATSATLATLRSDVNTNAGNISSNAADIDALESSLSALTTSSVVTVDDTATPGEGIAKVYTIKQGNVDVCTINIPKDFLVKSAVISTVVDSDISVGGKLEDKGFELGDKYIDFTVNSKDDDSEESHVYLNVKDLVDVYTAKENATQVQLTIGSNNEISAAIVNGSITEAKLHADVQAKLAKAVTAIQTTDMNAAISSAIAELDSSATAQSDNYINSITMVDGKITAIGQAALPSYTLSSGSANGTVSFNGTDVAVTGLKSAAYAETSAFDAAGAASAVLGTNTDDANAATVYGAKAFAAGVQTTVTGTEADASTALTLNGLSKRVAAASASALEAANSYTDKALAWQVISDN